MGMIFLGGTFSGLFLPVLVQGINFLGWRMAMSVLGIGFLSVGIPAAIIVRDRPEKYGYKPDGEVVACSEAEGDCKSVGSSLAMADSEQNGMSVRQALRTRSFWMLTPIFGLLNLGPGAMFLHQVPYFVSIGFSPTQAASTVATFTLLSGIGRIGGGWIMDYIDRRIILALMALLSVLAFVTLLNVTEYWHTVVFALLFGLSFGATIPAQPMFVSFYHGIRSFGAITGIMQSLTVVTGVAAPVLMGWAYDTNESYNQAIIMLTLAISVAIPLALLLPKPPRSF